MLLLEEISRFHRLYFLGLGLIVLGLSEAILYNEPLSNQDLTSLFGDEECIEGLLSVSEGGDPVITSGYVSNVSPKTTYERETNDTVHSKSPISSVYELAELNQIKVMFTLIDETGPAHKKRFIISLKLGEEEFVGEGSSIKKAQQEASKLALNSTLYKHPPERTKIINLAEKKKTPVEKLEDWARKHNDVVIIYTYFEQSKLTDEGKKHNNFYHSGMYSKFENIHTAKVSVGNQAFSGEGVSLEIAKQNAASIALKSLQSNDGFCMLSSKEKSFFNKVFDYNVEDENPISLVHEFGTISNTPVSFDLYSEEGPAHIKKFVFRCKIGDIFESFGEGSSKKVAKREAAGNMVQQLRTHSSFKNCNETPKRTKTKKKKPRNLIKAVVKSYSEEDVEDNNAYSIPEELDPVSKLFQIQQMKHEMLPVFTLLEKTNKEFSFDVTVNDLTAVGTGPNKKLAKKRAAQAILDKMGYSDTKKKENSFSQKKKDFSEGNKDDKNVVPGINLYSNKLHEIPGMKEPPKSVLQNGANNKQKEAFDSKLESKDSPHRKDSQSQSKNKKSDSPQKFDLKPKSHLLTLSQQMAFSFQFSDFPKTNHSGFISLVSLTTDPPKVCYGVGETSSQAQDKAALSALGSLYKTQLAHISQILQQENSAPQKTEINFIEEDNIVQDSIIQQQKH